MSPFFPEVDQITLTTEDAKRFSEKYNAMSDAKLAEFVAAVEKQTAARAEGQTVAQTALAIIKLSLVALT